jgi:hypothetical protein
MRIADLRSSIPVADYSFLGPGNPKIGAGCVMDSCFDIAIVIAIDKMNLVRRLIDIERGIWKTSEAIFTLKRIAAIDIDRIISERTDGVLGKVNSSFGRSIEIMLVNGGAKAKTDKDFTISSGMDRAELASAFGNDRRIAPGFAMIITVGYA